MISSQQTFSTSCILLASPANSLALSSRFATFKLESPFCLLFHKPLAFQAKTATIATIIRERWPIILYTWTSKLWGLRNWKDLKLWVCLIWILKLWVSLSLRLLIVFISENPLNFAFKTIGPWDRQSNPQFRGRGVLWKEYWDYAPCGNVVNANETLHCRIENTFLKVNF